MKIAIQTESHRIFALSDEAVELYLQKKKIPYTKVNNTYGSYNFMLEDGSRFYDYRFKSKDRTDPILIEVIEELGDRASAGGNKVEVIDVPEGCFIGSDGYNDILLYECPHCYNYQLYEDFKSQKWRRKDEQTQV